MVAGRIERIGQTRIEGSSIMDDLRGFAVHDARRPYDLAAESLPESLMPQTNAEERHAARERLEQGKRNASLVGGAGSRRDDDTFRLESARLVNGDLVVSIDPDILAELAKILHEVIGKG